MLRGTVIEVADVDPALGAVFYTLDQQAQAKPKFERQTHNCLQCHDSVLNTGARGYYYNANAKYTFPALSNGITPYVSGQVGYWDIGTSDAFYGTAAMPALSKSTVPSRLDGCREGQPFSVPKHE